MAMPSCKMIAMWIVCPSLTIMFWKWNKHFTWGTKMGRRSFTFLQPIERQKRF
jgi:hypothetical protein